MRKKTYTVGITFFTTEKMYFDIITASDMLQISQSEFIRGVFDDYFSRQTEQNQRETEV